MPSDDHRPTASSQWTRRALLSAVAAAGALAGCSSQNRSPDGGGTTTRTAAPTTEPTTTAAATTEEPPCSPGERHVGDASIAVEGAWPQFQAGPGNAGSADGAGPADSSLAWRYATCSRLGESPPVVADGTVYVSGDRLRAFDATTGEPAWELGLESSTAPVVDGGVVYFAGRDVAAVDASERSVLWRDERRSEILARSSPALAGGTLYVPGAVDDPALRAFDAATGEQEWELALDGEHGPESPAVADGRVYVTDDGNRLVSATRDGDDVRVLAGGSDDPGVFSAPAVADGTVYVGGLEGLLRAFDAATGEQEWAYRVSESGIPGPPVVGGGRVYVVESSAVHALTTDGGRAWRQPTGDLDFGLPVYADGALYAGCVPKSLPATGTPTGAVVSLDAADGGRRWRHRTRGWRTHSERRVGTTAPVAVVDGAVFAATGAGDVLALG